MKILINTASTHKGGSVQVARSFIEECKNFGKHEFHIVLGISLSELINTLDYPDNFSFYSLGYRPATRVFSVRSQDQDLKRLEVNIKPDVVFSTTGPAYWRPKAPHLVGYNLPHYVYQDSPFFKLIPYQKRLKWYFKGQVIKYFFKKDGDAYVVQTDDVNRRLKKWLNRKNIYTVSNTYSDYYHNPKEVTNKLPQKIDGEFRLLCLSAWYPHKNLGVISKVISVLPESVKQRVTFILTLPAESYRSNFSSQLNGYIKNVGPVNPDECPALYNECDALFLPTLLECFSASYAEAMKMKKPIITSDLGFAHTVCGDAALYADPLDPNEIAQKISLLIEKPDLGYQLVQNGERQKKNFLSARERAEKYLEICEQLVYEEKDSK